MNKTAITALCAAALLSLGVSAAETGTKVPEQTQAQSQSQHQSININTASVEELTLLTGVGESKAKAIVDYRTSHGRFNSVADLAKVKGIGSKLVEKNRSVISL
ncbi:ComEA family DNA-binding protein [uncultured Shewanella sp.]|uniref:ComEA family DNA-binding protein n=1 Tax=Shewanella atlantica TaxID=271099 RepID=UPI00261685AB|nr:ComEA family DNA-binding protein [uncultured Shewanella sp.]